LNGGGGIVSINGGMTRAGAFCISDLNAEAI
jgi:hypothetical protein